MAVNVEKKPTAAFALSILAGIFTLVGAFLASAITSLLVPGFPSDMLLIWGSIAGVLVLVGSWLLYNNAAQRKLGSTLVLVFSILSMNLTSTWTEFRTGVRDRSLDHTRPPCIGLGRG